MIKKEILAQVFFCDVCEISKNTLSTEHLQATVSVTFLVIIEEDWNKTSLMCYTILNKDCKKGIEFKNLFH